VPRAPAPAPVYAEPVARPEPVQPARAKAEAGARRKVEARVETRVPARVVEPEPEEEEEVKSKGKGKMVIFAIAAILLVAVGIFVALNLRKSPASATVPGGAVTQQAATATPEESTTGIKPKPTPSAATTAPTQATTAATTTQDTASQEETTPSPAPAQSAAMLAQLNAGSKISINKPTADKDAAPTSSLSGMDNMGGNSSAPGVFNSGKGGPKVTAAEAPKTLNVSGSVMAGRAISKTPPVYPRFARDARVDGTVVLHATISKAGTISNVSVISGPAMLRQAAMDAVKTWRYKPYLLNNEPVEVETTVNVIFVLNG
jgi:protein TonB